MNLEINSKFITETYQNFILSVKTSKIESNKNRVKPISSQTKIESNKNRVKQK